MASFFSKRRKTIARITLFAVTLLLFVKDCGIFYSQAASKFNTRSSNNSSNLWEWTLCKSESDFPTSDTRIIMCFGDRWVCGGINDRSGSMSNGYYIPTTSGESLEYSVLEPIGDLDKFITRGYVPSFWMGRWDSGRYYFKPHNNTNYYIEHIDKDIFESGCDNWWFETVDGCRKDEKSFGSQDVYWMFKVRSYGNNEFGFYIPNSGDDFYICDNFCGDDRFGVGYRGDDNSHNKIRIYKGKQISSPTRLIKSGSYTYTIRSGDVMTVKDITYLPRNYYLEIEDGAMLIVSGRFINNGQINVKGTLIIDGSGFIFPLDSENDDGRILVQNGDIILRKGSKVIIKKLKATGGNIINKEGYLLTVLADLDSTLIDNTGIIRMGRDVNRSWVKTASDYQSTSGYDKYSDFFGSYVVNIKNRYRIINNGELQSFVIYVNEARYKKSKSNYGLADAKYEGKYKIFAYGTSADHWFSSFQ